MTLREELEAVLATYYDNIPSEVLDALEKVVEAECEYQCENCDERVRRR